MGKIRRWFARTPKPLKRWLLYISPIVATVAVITATDKYLGLGIFLSFFRGEFSVFLLMGKAGLSQAQAVAITIVCSTLALINYFWWEKQADRSDAVRNWLYRTACRLLDLLGIQVHRAPDKKNNRMPASGFRKIAKKFPYFILPLYCFEPMLGFPSGVLFAKLSGLNMKIAFALMFLGNFTEKILWSYLAKNILPLIQGVLGPILFFFLGGLMIVQLLGFIRDYEEHPQNPS